ncbi:methylaspartate ammonia-lyase [Mesorhizobium tianshanense]|uniref:methylaspartate ammonia-lyase n=2 Tax=Mesorhizobium tianshanense TaxID=39844 RepID=A0A562NBK3_9HYPH|nr:methylaspartate ammonia-lyase [Mesorhizobium tianshanense]GLS34938.1 methylaspartate ammonia-lyase [Mesorhizobium tianshanense]
MKIDRVVCSVGRSGYFHIDFAALRSGVTSDGFIYDGEPQTPGFTKIVEPADAISVMLVLDDGQVGFGDCCDVVFAGVSGRDPVLRGHENLPMLEGEVAGRLCGRDVSDFRSLAQELDNFVYQGHRLHVALRYGLTQAILHAVALTNRETMAEVLAREYDTTLSTTPIPISVSCEPDDARQLDRMILKQPAILPHTYFTDVEQLGRDGEKLLEHIRHLSSRVKAIGGAAYTPALHFDFYGVLGELFSGDTAEIATLIGRATTAAGPLPLLIESPVLEESQKAQIDSLRKLRCALRKAGVNAGIIADDWCNSIDDIRLFADQEASDYVQIKMPDLGGVNNSMEAVLYCKAHGMGAFLGGSANETDQSTRISMHIALASRPDFIGSKPGLGGDEALMIQSNEMGRTLELIRRRRQSA